LENDILTLEEVAAYLKLKPQTIYTWAQEKKIPAAKLGKEWRFKKSIIDEWIVLQMDEKFGDVIASWKRTRPSGRVVSREDQDCRSGMARASQRAFRTFFLLAVQVLHYSRLILTIRLLIIHS
jgi:excisionase family DNA binding protein